MRRTIVGYSFLAVTPGFLEPCRWCHARHHFRTIRRVVHKPRHDGRRLHQVTRLHAIMDGHVRVMCARLILHRILHKAETRQSDPGERGVIGAARLHGVARGCAHDSGCAEVPSFENWLRHVVSANVDAAEFAGADVVIIVSRELVELRSLLYGIAAGKAFLHVRFRAQQALFFTAPQGDADGAVKGKFQFRQQAHGFNGHGAASRVISGAGAAVPGIQVAAKHHEFVLVRTCARDLADHIEGLFGPAQELGLNVELELHRNLVGDQTGDAIVVFRGEGDQWRRDRDL